MDQAGRVVIPRTTREKYGLLHGSHDLELEESVDGIVLRPSSEAVPAERHPSGWVVFRSAEAEVVDPVIAVQKARERRHRAISGEPSRSPRRDR